MADWDVVSTTPAAASPTKTGNAWNVAGETPQMSGLARIPALIASSVGEGAANIAAIPGEMANLGYGLGNKIGEWIKPDTKSGSSPAAAAVLHHMIRSQDVADFGERTGLWERPDLTPQDNGERYIAAGARGAGSAIPALLGGPAAVVPALVSGTASGVGSQAGADLMPDHPVVGALIGGLAGGFGATGAMGMARKGVNAANNVGNATTDAYADLGMTPRLSGDVTDNKFLKGLQAFAAKTPFGAGKIAKAASQTADEFGAASDRVASTLGSAATAQDVGTVLQGESKNWMDRFKLANQKNWNALDQYFPDIGFAKRVNVSNYSKALDSISDDLPAAPATAKVLQPGFTRQLADALKQDIGESDVLPWRTVKGIRSRIGEMLEDPNLPADAGTAELKRLYAGLSKDMQAAVKEAGPEAEAAFKTANTVTANGHKFIDGILRPLIREGQTPEGAASSVLPKMNKGGSVITQIRQEMPAAADEIAAFKIRDMTAAAAGKQNATGDAVSSSSFLTDWNKLSPEAKAALYQDPGVRQKLDSMAKVSEGIKDTMAMANHSNTGSHNSYAAMFHAIKDAVLGGVGGHMVGGHSGSLIGAGLGLSAPMGGYFASALTSSPRLTSYFAAPGLLNPGAARLATGLGLVPAAQQPRQIPYQPQ
jgi:hypothetical protein